MTDLAEIERLVGDYGSAVYQRGKSGARAECDALLSAIRSLAAPREVEEVRAALATIVSNEGGCGTQSDEITTTCRARYPDRPGCWCGFCVASAALRRARGEK